MTNPGNPNQPRDPQGRFRKRWGWGSAAAVLLTSALVAGSAGAGAGGAVGGAGTSASGRSSSGSQAKARARSTARVVQRLESRGLRVEERAVDVADDCVAHSYGQVRQFFVEHPCTTLYRGLFEIRDGWRGVAVVAVAFNAQAEPVGRTARAAQLAELASTTTVG